STCRSRAGPRRSWSPPWFAAPRSRSPPPRRVTRPPSPGSSAPSPALPSDLRAAEAGRPARAPPTSSPPTPPPPRPRAPVGAAPLDDGVGLTAWPGEARECVEIARAIQHEAARGTPFDRLAVLLRAPGDYVPHLEEAFARASIPYFFARAARRPHPAGRALLALLACAAEGLSARRFAEYLSLAQVP